MLADFLDRREIHGDLNILLQWRQLFAADDDAIDG